jgi:hypothetical protein
MFSNLDHYGRVGVSALAKATPSETGETANAWRYEISRKRGRVTINWINDHVDDGVNVAVIIQYGHGTGTGGYVEGRDYINPAMRPVFDQIAQDVWRQVTNG